ncbi:hypothetical protein MPTK1_5g07520 [Marchantia polymorpha subsp. ruderalis]|uniref:Uncharacterized protein n=1 Tax=Marchantia polymorpha subsp. ruderalis TaxID=1480154 RepID=A0AAF6BFY1_MARPO|nr:hypothetical protein Mp_5g07520 [Marchantia polymorpha subsp. ruderalis]
MAPQAPQSDVTRYEKLADHGRLLCQRTLRTKSVQKCSKRVSEKIRLDCTRGNDLGVGRSSARGEKVRCLLRLMEEQQQQLQRHLSSSSTFSEMQQIRARRLKSLFFLAQHLDNRSSAQFHGSLGCRSGSMYGPETFRLEDRLSRLSFSD